MTDPSLGEILLSCFLFFSFLAFMISYSLLTAKRIVAWFERRSQLRHPPSVYNTLNMMNISEDSAEMITRHYDPTRGGRNA